MIYALISTTIEKLIKQEKLDIDKKLNIVINIDNPKLEDERVMEKEIIEKLTNNKDISQFHHLIKNSKFSISFLNSKLNPLIRVSDFIANICNRGLNPSAGTTDSKWSKEEFKDFLNEIHTYVDYDN